SPGPPLTSHRRRKGCRDERPWQTKRRSPSAKSEAPGIRGVNGRTLTPKRRVSSVHGGWATAAAVAAAEAHLVAAAAALVVAVVVEAAAAAGERHLPAVVV